MTLIMVLEDLLAALLLGDEEESRRLVRDTLPVFEKGARELSRDELVRAMELHEKCTAAALELRPRLVDEMRDASRPRKTAPLYLVRS